MNSSLTYLVNLISYSKEHIAKYIMNEHMYNCMYTCTLVYRNTLNISVQIYVLPHAAPSTKLIRRLCECFKHIYNLKCFHTIHDYRIFRQQHKQKKEKNKNQQLKGILNTHRRLQLLLLSQLLCFTFST